ncbi:NAD(P)H-dependent oxidoreductase [Pasteurellaceae bacterium LIM206]|nr:NAD(P)H-dependent oxidoreductase [Pasteurellaceae bacterium LIM206]
MNHVIIFAHPNTTQSFNRAVLDSIVKVGNSAGITTTVRDLYTMNFNPVLSWEELSATFSGIVPTAIKYEQQLITNADLITMVYPLWWMGFPAILKGYLDRVLTVGFAYQTDNDGAIGLLQGKKMQQFVTIGNNVERYQEIGFAKSLDDCLVNGLFNYCGITDIDCQFFGDIHLVDDAARQAILDAIERKTQENITALLQAQ